MDVHLQTVDVQTVDVQTVLIIQQFISTLHVHTIWPVNLKEKSTDILNLSVISFICMLLSKWRRLRATSLET